MKITATIITLNEERNIARAIESLRCCDEILILDSGSTDRTVELATNLRARVIEAGWRGYAGQKNWAADQASHDWILSLDADEALSETLEAEIWNLKKSGPQYDAYTMPRALGGMDSMASELPSPHSPPMAMPNRARQMRKLVSEGAKAEARPKTENETMFSIRVGRRPKRSAIRPKRRAPTGRMTSVQKIASAMDLMLTWKSAAIALRQRVRRKKSNASSVQPRKHAAKVCLWTALSDRSSLRIAM